MAGVSAKVDLSQYRRFFNNDVLFKLFAKAFADDFISLVTLRTPFRTGLLAKSWHIGREIDNIKIWNRTHYAEWVENGNHGWTIQTPGFRMLGQTLDEAHKIAYALLANYISNVEPLNNMPDILVQYPKISGEPGSGSMLGDSPRLHSATNRGLRILERASKKKKSQQTPIEKHVTRTAIKSKSTSLMQGLEKMVKTGGLGSIGKPAGRRWWEQYEGFETYEGFDRGKQ